MTPAPAVRELEPADVPAVRELFPRVLDEDLGYGFRPDWHADIADPVVAYLRTPGRRLFLAEDVAGTTGVRRWWPAVTAAAGRALRRPSGGAAGAGLGAPRTPPPGRGPGAG